MAIRCNPIAGFKRVCFAKPVIAIAVFLCGFDSPTGGQQSFSKSLVPPNQLATISLAICQAGDATGDLLKPMLKRDITVESEPVLFRQTEIGITTRVLSKADNSLLLEVQRLSPPGRPPQTRVTSYLASDSASETPDTMPDARLALSDDCSVRAAHQLIYDDGVALYLTALDSELQPAGEKQWLNPEVPGRHHPDTQNRTDTLNEDTATDNTDHQITITAGLVDSGVNYQIPEIFNGLAMNDQGGLLGYDFWDMDDKPFDANPARSPFFVQRHGTRTASIFLREAPGVKLAPYRYPRNNMHRMTDLIAHADERGIRVIGMPLGSNTYADWVAFEASAKEHPHILFIVSAGNNGRDIDRIGVYPAAMDIENMLVVTSADDFVHPAERTNYGRISVDYMVPAEHIDAIDFNGDEIKVSGSSYAVARVLALAARLLSQAPDQSVDELKASIKTYAVRGQTSRFVAIGYLGDPLASTDYANLDITVDEYDQPNTDTPADYTMPLQLVRLDSRWNYQSLAEAIDNANRIYRQCKIELRIDSTVTVRNAGYLSDLTSGHALTLSRALSQANIATIGEANNLGKVTRVFLASDTKMLEQYDANAFGIGNTRNRPWMTNSLWLTHGIEDTDIALAHELFHIASNSGEHSTLAGNLMQSRTLADNISLSDTQCDDAVRQGTANGLLHQRD